MLNVSEIKRLSEPKLNTPTFILGLSDQYGINDTIAQALIERTRSKKFAELYSPFFPDYAIAEDTGLCHLPRYELYASELFDPNAVIMTGDERPSFEDSQAHYDIFDLVFNFAKELGCSRFLSFGTFQRSNPEDKIYVAATTGNLVSLITRKFGGKPFVKGRIDSLIGMILGLAKIQRLPAICVLGSFSESPSQDTVQTILHYVSEVLRFKSE